MYMIPSRGFIVVKDTYNKVTQEVHREVIGNCQTLDDAKRIALNEYRSRRDFLISHTSFCDDILYEFRDEQMELRYNTWPSDYGPNYTDHYRVLEYELTTKEIHLAE